MKSTFKRVLLAIAATAVIGFGFTGCQQEAETEYVYFDITGTWTSPKGAQYPETYTITSTTFDNGYYSGDNLVIRQVSEDEGYIYIKYTCSMNDDYSYSTTAPDVGKWYAISYKGLRKNTIQLSGAYKVAGATSKETLEEAISEFTIENGYFDFYSSLLR